MKFYCIIEKANDDNIARSSLLKTSCQERKVDFIQVIAEDFNYVRSDNLTTDQAIIFNATPYKESAILEKYLINKKSITFYSNFDVAMSNRSNSFFYNQKAGLPVIKSIPSIHKDRRFIQEHVDFLGGFPIVLKVTGNSHGVGVIKVDSLESLHSLIDYLSTLKVKILLRQFIPHKKQGRLIVLGDKVIASHVNYRSIDFRTNVGDNAVRQRDPMVFTPEVQDIAVQAVRSAGLEFGGVDILFHEKTDQPFISEVNFPCYFPTTQNITGIDIAGAMVDYLVAKAKRSL